MVSLNSTKSSYKLIAYDNPIKSKQLKRKLIHIEIDLTSLVKLDLSSLFTEIQIKIYFIHQIITILNSNTSSRLANGEAETHVL